MNIPSNPIQKEGFKAASPLGLGPHLTLAATLRHGRSEVALRLAAALRDLRPGGCCGVACRSRGNLRVSLAMGILGFNDG